MIEASYLNPQHLALFILGINVFAYGCMSLDKQLAKRRARRIPEANLLLLAMLGGALGIWLGMKSFRHKTATPRFYFRLIGIALLQVMAVIYLGFRA